MPAQVHPSAVLSPETVLADDCVIGPFAVLDGRVTLGPGVVVGPHCHLLGELVVGAGCRFHAGCVIGDWPQHLGYKGEPTRTEVGERSVFPENVTVHRGMPAGVGPGIGVTRVGSDCFLMAGSHVAHDCTVGDGVVLANGR